MSRHASSDNSNSLGLFPFLAVLMSTMGALLVVMVILAQRAGQQAAVESMQGSRDSRPQVESGDAAKLVRQLEEVRQYQRQLDELRQEAETRVREEQDRLSHVEEHTRRLEHELARLSLAAQQLEATEKNQIVDQQQAEGELERLKQTITDTEKQLEELRKPGNHRRSYAIVPYKGLNGTYRKPIYIECTAKGIILQPEGLQFKRSDFVDPTWPGNPLAAALRASREYLNEQAAQIGEAELPDPYPLILVRPDGVTSYLLARLAITSWDSAFGYEFIDADWKVEYPDLPDPQLARIQQHAVMMARERLARLEQAAPSQFRGVGIGSDIGGSSNHRAEGQYGYGGGDGGGPGSASGGALAESYAGTSGRGNGAEPGGEGDLPGGEGKESATGGAFSSGGDFRYGAMGDGDSSNGSNSGGGSGGSGNGGGGSPGSGELASANGSPRQGIGSSGATSPTGQPGSQPGGGQPGDSTAATAMANGYAAGGTPGAGAAGAGQLANAGGAASGQAASGSTGGGGQSASVNLSSGGNNSSAQGPQQSRTIMQGTIADSRGSDWALQNTLRNAIPVRRPIQVVVRQNQMALLPSRHATQGIDATGTVISLDQPLDKISEEFVTALKTRIDEWGLAGNGLYWRPVLELHVGPDAAETAAHLNHLLKDSGVEVRLPETAQKQQGGATHAPR